MTQPRGVPAGEHAVVIGASMAGLLAARALSGAYRRVTIVERDELPPIGKTARRCPRDAMRT